MKEGLTSGGSKKSTGKMEETEGEEAVASAPAGATPAVGGAEHAASNSGSLSRWEREGLQPLLEVRLALFVCLFWFLCMCLICVRVFLVFFCDRV